MPFPAFVLISSVIAVGTAGAALALSQQRALAIGAALTGSFALLIFHGPVFFDLFPVDDAYITFRYSQHLADGLGPNWNSQGHVEGYTSFLWMALLAGLDKGGLDLLDGARLLAWLSLAGTLASMVAIWRLWASEHPGSAIESPVVIAVALLGVTIADGVAFWGFSGLETPLLMLLLTVGALCYLRDRRCGGYPWSALVFVAAALTRPEGVVAAAVTGAFVLAEAARATDRRRALIRAATWGATFAVLYGTYFLWRWTYYDSFLPNTFYAKVGPTTGVIERGTDYIVSALVNYYLLATFAGTAVLLTLPRLRWDAAYLIAIVSALLAAIAIEGGDSFGHGRFIAPLLPLAYLGGIAGLSVLVGVLQIDVRQASAAAAALLAIAGLVLLRGSDNPYVPQERQVAGDRQLLGEWLRDNTPADYTIAAFAVGSVAYYSEREFLDMLGLNDRTIAHTDIDDFGAGIAGHEKYNVDYVLDVVRPEIIITGDAEPGPIDIATYRASQTSVGGLPAKVAYMSDPRIWQRYQLRSVQIGGRWFNFLQRTDTMSR
jgi:hypothetical protein